MPADLTSAGMNPDQSMSTLAYTMEMNTARAERQYRTGLDEARKADSQSGQVAWVMDKFDRIY